MNCLRCGAEMYRVVNAKDGGSAKATCSRCSNWTDCAFCPGCNEFVICPPCYAGAKDPSKLDAASTEALRRALPQSGVPSDFSL